MRVLQGIATHTNQFILLCDMMLGQKQNYTSTQYKRINENVSYKKKVHLSTENEWTCNSDREKERSRGRNIPDGMPLDKPDIIFNGNKHKKKTHDAHQYCKRNKKYFPNICACVRYLSAQCVFVCVVVCVCMFIMHFNGVVVFFRREIATVTSHVSFNAICSKEKKIMQSK